jgi:hypothetical protein
MSFVGDYPVLATTMMVATVALSLVLGLSLTLNTVAVSSGGEPRDASSRFRVRRDAPHALS